VPTSALLTPEVQKVILAEVAERLKPMQGDLLAGADDAAPALDLLPWWPRPPRSWCSRPSTSRALPWCPRVRSRPAFHPFTLDVSQLRLQPGEREIVGQMLRTNEQFTLAAEIGLKEQRPEDYIVHALVDFDDIDYFTHADLLYDLAGQMVRHLRSYLSESEAVSVLDRDRRLIARRSTRR
jgi:type III restriction enzyme